MDRVDKVDEGKKVTINDNPILCGGTFFALLLDAKVEAMSQREHWKGHKDERVIPNLMSRLLWVMNGAEVKLTGKAAETFGSNVNKYRLCKINGGAHVPLKRTDAEVKAFDRMVREEYSTVLERMDQFLRDVLDFREEVGKPEPFWIRFHKTGIAIIKNSLFLKMEILFRDVKCLPCKKCVYPRLCWECGMHR